MTEQKGEAPAASLARVRVNYVVVAYFIVVHALAASAFFLPVRAAHVALAVFVYFFVGFCTTTGLHRLLSHRSFACPKWVEYLLVTGAMLTGQGSPLLWVANHRIHHARSDRDGDIHSPRRGFWYSHIGWIVDDGSTDALAYRRYCKDLAHDRYYHWLVRYRMAPQVAAVVFVGLALGWAAVPLVFLLPVVCWMHSTYSVNSVCHHRFFGARAYATRDGSRNVWWVALVALGEGWHNNHHAFPRSVRHGLTPRQVDLSYLFVLLLKSAGLAWDLRLPDRAALSRARVSGEAAEARGELLESQAH